MVNRAMARATDKVKVTIALRPQRLIRVAILMRPEMVGDTGLSTIGVAETVTIRMILWTTSNTTPSTKMTQWIQDTIRDGLLDTGPPRDIRSIVIVDAISRMRLASGILLAIHTVEEAFLFPLQHHFRYSLLSDADDSVMHIPFTTASGYLGWWRPGSGGWCMEHYGRFDDWVALAAGRILTCATTSWLLRTSVNG